MPVILLDTFEDVGDRTHRDLECRIQRVVWLMPNAFFIVTGRSRLQWAEPALQGRLDYTGPGAWPGLAASVDGWNCPLQRGRLYPCGLSSVQLIRQERAVTAGPFSESRSACRS